MGGKFQNMASQGGICVIEGPVCGSEVSYQDVFTGYEIADDIALGCHRRREFDNFSQG